MDLATVIGIVLGIGALLATCLMEGTALSSLVNLPALVLITGGSLGAAMIGAELKDALRIPLFVKDALFAPSHGLLGRARELLQMAHKARQEGLLALEEEAENASDEFTRKGIQLIVDGAEPEVLRAVLESELEIWEERESVGVGIFEAIGGYCPTLGIMGAVLGLMHALGQSDDPAKMAGAIAVAFVATLYGVGFANMFFLPVAEKLKVRVADQRTMYEMTMFGFLSIQAGENPRIASEKLSSYLPPAERGALEETPAGEEQAQAA